MGDIIRFGISMDSSLLQQFDTLIAKHGYSNRSEAFRDLVRDRLVREAEQPPGECEAQQQGQRGAHRQAHATGGDLVGHQQRGEQCAGHRAQRHEGDPATAEEIRRTYRRFTGTEQAYPMILYDCKKLVLHVALSSELTVLARKLDRISEQHRYSRDFTLRNLEDSLAEVIACFPVYRTYIREDEPVGDDDRTVIETAIRAAKRRNPSTSESVFDFIRSILLHQDPDGLTKEQQGERRLP